MRQAARRRGFCVPYGSTLRRRAALASAHRSFRLIALAGREAAPRAASRSSGCAAVAGPLSLSRGSPANRRALRRHLRDRGRSRPLRGPDRRRLLPGLRRQPGFVSAISTSSRASPTPRPPRGRTASRTSPRPRQVPARGVRARTPGRSLRGSSTRPSSRPDARPPVRRTYPV
jgi:hypothetical protein